MDSQQKQDQQPGHPQPDQQQEQGHTSTSRTKTPPEGTTLNSSATTTTTIVTTSADASQPAPTIAPAATSDSLSSAVHPSSSRTPSPAATSAPMTGSYPAPEGPPPATTLIAVPVSNPPPQAPPTPSQPASVVAPTLNPSTTETRPSSSSVPSSAGLAATAPTGSTNAPTSTEQKEYWCHKCRREITPIMIPDPICPYCHNDFVEEIEPNNDPRAFVQQYPGSHSSGDRHIPGAPGPHEPVNLEDLFRLFQAVSNPQRMAHQYQQRQQQTSPFGGQGQRSGSSQAFVFSTGPSGFTRTVTTTLGSDGRVQTSTNGSGHGADATHVGGDSQGQWHEPPAFISGLLNRLGIQLSYTTDPRAFQSFGVPMGGGPGFFPIVSNPGDYAWGQGGLDDIISQMMELQNRQHGPVGATDELINNIPHHTLSDAELADKTECSVCKDEFTKEDTLLQLPCKHIFHEACIKPWLKVSGTCPTCRYSLIEGHPATTDALGSAHVTPPPANANATAGTTGAAGTASSLPGSLPGSLPTATSSSSASTAGAAASNPSLPHEPLD